MTPFSTRKLRLRDGKCLAQGHLASQWWAWDWTPSLDPEAHDMVFQIWHDFPKRWGSDCALPCGLAPRQSLASPGPLLLAAEQGRADKASAVFPSLLGFHVGTAGCFLCNCSFFPVAVKRPPSAKKGECSVVFLFCCLVLIHCVRVSESQLPGWVWGRAGRGTQA